MNEIPEGNKLIAEFHGSEKIFGRIADEDRKYHTSWDWLMPVCKKIVDSVVNLPTIELRKTAYKYHSPIEDGVCNFLIENTWQAVVKFIKWYNQNKTS